MTKTNLAAFLGPPQVVRWNKASYIKKLKDIDLPELSVWNYGPCDYHETPTPECQYQACGGEPFKHQKKTAVFSYTTERSLVANSTGTGKTISALLTLAIAHHHGEEIRALVVVPTTAVHQWYSETRRWTPGFTAACIPSKTPEAERLATYARKWNVLIVGYHAFQRDEKYFPKVPIRQVIVDDVDPSLNTQNETYKALKKVCDRSKLTIVQNATSLQAQSLDSKILVPGGWVRMRDVSVGDMVLTPNGRPAPIQGISERKVAPVYRVTLSDGSTTRASGDHLWRVKYASTAPGNSSRKRITVEATLSTEEILRRGLTVGKRGRLKFAVPQPVLNTPNVDLPLPPYTLGVLIGDGHLGGRTMNFSSMDREIVDRVRTDLEGFAKVTPVSRSGQSTVYTLGSEVRQKVGSAVTDAVKSLGLHGHLSYSKFIPEIYQHSGYQQRIDLLRGLMDTDGTSNGGQVYYTTSPQLAEDVANLVRSLGGWAKTTKRLRPEGCGYIHYVSFNLPLINPFHLPRKAVRWSGGARRVRNIQSIELDGEEEVQCILVGDSDHLYVTDDYIVTHNTSLLQLYAASSLIGGNDVWGSKTSFTRTYVKKGPVYVKTKKGPKRVFKAIGYQNMKLFKKKFDPMSIRITYEDIVDDVTIPDLMTEQVYFDLSKKQRIRYAELQQGVRTILNATTLTTSQKSIGALAAFTIGSQICSGLFSLKTSDGGYEPDSDDASPKLDWIMGKLKDEWSDEKVVVYAKFRGAIRAIQDRLDNEGIGHATIWGVVTDPEERKAEMDRFWTDPDCKVMIISVSGERSLNLQNASILVMWDLQLNPARVSQLAGRVRRLGSKHKRVFVFELLHSDTQEERYMAALAARQTLFDYVYDVDDSNVDSDNLLIEKLDPDQVLRLIQP